MDLLELVWVQLPDLKQEQQRLGLKGWRQQRERRVGRVRQERDRERLAVGLQAWDVHQAWRPWVGGSAAAGAR